MKNTTHLYVSRKNVLTWLMALCMVASAVARVAFPGLKGSGESANVWIQILLPITATTLYALIALFSGEEFFFKTAIPVWMMAIYSGLWISANVSGRMIWIHILTLSPDPFKPGKAIRATAEATMQSAISQVSTFLRLT